MHIVAVSILGDELEGVKVDRFESQSKGKNLAGHFHGNTASGIPYGEYRARIYVAGFWSVERAVRVFQPRMTAVVELPVGTEGGPQTSDVSGHIQNGDFTIKPVRIRLVGIYSSTILDAEVDSKGDFSLAQVPNGNYILTVTQGARMLAVRPIRLPAAQLPILIGVDERSTDATAQSK